MGSSPEPKLSQFEFQTNLIDTEHSVEMVGTTIFIEILLEPGLFRHAQSII